MILDGALDHGNEADLGARLAVSARHLRRLFTVHLGVTPDGLARSGVCTSLVASSTTPT